MQFISKYISPPDDVMCFCHPPEKGFVKEYDLEKHASVHNTHRPFMCNHCGDAFKSEVRLKEHGILLHGQGSEDQRLVIQQRQVFSDTTGETKKSALTMELRKSGSISIYQFTNLVIYYMTHPAHAVHRYWVACSMTDMFNITAC